MEISILLAKFWGFLLVISGLLFLLRKEALNDIFELVKNKAFAGISGYLALILGLVTVILHNLWTADWRIAITIFGWISLIKGIVIILFPKGPLKLVGIFEKKTSLVRILLIAAVFLGSWLIWMVYSSQ